MPLDSALKESFERSFGLYADLAASVERDVLASKLPGLPSSTVGGQLWCVVGARESYSRAIENGAWSGFSCSLGDPSDPASVTDALDRSRRAARAVLEALTAPSDVQSRLVIDLLEHEAQHHGQLIRYLYGLGLDIPASWQSRYALSPR